MNMMVLLHSNTIMVWWRTKAAAVVLCAIVIVYGCISDSAPQLNLGEWQSLATTNLMISSRPSPVVAHNWRIDASEASDVSAEDEVKRMSRTQLLRKLASVQHLLVEGRLAGIVIPQSKEARTFPGALTAPPSHDRRPSIVAHFSSPPATNSSANTIDAKSALALEVLSMCAREERRQRSIITIALEPVSLNVIETSKARPLSTFSAHENLI